jgi:hypothetical protein
MDATYLVFFHRDALIGTDNPIQALRVESATFIAVEDWAMDNVPVGWTLRTIEKQYGTPTELDMFGAPEVTLP